MVRSVPVQFRWLGLSVLGLVGGSWPTRALADIYTYEDKDGVLHFTNMPRGKGWRRLMPTGPGKAVAGRGCKGCDRVPARDRSPLRHYRFDRDIQQAAALYQIPMALVRAVIKTESDFDPRVISIAGARGLMQLMPGTQREMGVADAFDARENIFGGTRFLRVLANRYDGDLTLTIAAYHAGPGAVDRYDGIPPYQTTQQYLRTVLRNYYRFKTQFP